VTPRRELNRSNAASLPDTDSKPSTSNTWNEGVDVACIAEVG
jgi:hypothetical protein